MSEAKLKEHRAKLYELREIASCVYQTPEDALQHRLNLNNLNIFRLYEDLQSLLTFDYTLHEQIGCLLDALFYPYTNTLLHDRVHSYIAEPKGLGYGFNVFLSGFNQDEPLFVIKNNSLSMLECLYEYVIGKLIVNPLRALTPNFMYTYGYHECGSMHTTLQEEKNIWCTTDEPQDGYLYLERIIGDTLLEFALVHEEDSEPFVQVILQIINALYIAYEECSFRHNDLHGRNIVIREIGNLVCVPISVLGKEQYLYTRYIPQIIDFGVATAMYEGEMLQSPSYDNTLGENNKSFPYDMYMRGVWTDIWEYFEKCPRMPVWIEHLRETSEENQTFAYIASSFIETMGYNPLRDGYVDTTSVIVPFTLPLHFIDNTDRFYRRYYIDRKFSLEGYYHLMDLINTYHLTTDIKDNFDPPKISVADMVTAVKEQVHSLVQDFPPLGLQKVVVEGMEDTVEGIFLRIDRLYEIVDHLYLLKSYQRLILPVMHKYKLASKHDEKILSDAIDVVSQLYNKKLRQTRASFKELQHRYYYDGYSFEIYERITNSASTRLLRFPRAKDV